MSPVSTDYNARRRPLSPRPSYRPFLDWAKGSARPELSRGCTAKPQPFRLAVNRLFVDAADHHVVNHDVIVIAPIGRLPCFDVGLGTRFAEQKVHAAN
jgi:hypothetical protein